jgi:hypothetical protein
MRKDARAHPPGPKLRPDRLIDFSVHGVTQSDAARKAGRRLEFIPTALDNGRRSARKPYAPSSFGCSGGRPRSPARGKRAAQTLACKP